MDRRLKGNIGENFWREEWMVIEESQSMGLYFVNIYEITPNNMNERTNKCINPSMY
jgi:hypothetical protein